MSRVVVSEHRTRTAARIAKGKWRRRRERAVKGNERAKQQLRDAHVPAESGKLVVERSSGRESEKWSLLFEPTHFAQSSKQPPGPATPPRSDRHRPIG